MKGSIFMYQGKSYTIEKKNVLALCRNKQKYRYTSYMQVMLMRLMSKYLIDPKGRRSSGSVKSVVLTITSIIIPHGV